LALERKSIQAQRFDGDITLRWFFDVMFAEGHHEDWTEDEKNGRKKV
jgi:hypothetical protein